ncbi:11376_t:CDS:10, partial [Acaulospora colombiana]
WKFNRVPLGWAANQFQMWARGYFDLFPEVKNESETIPILIQCQPVGDFYVDDRRLFGDWYGYEKSWHVLRLRPGRHVINVRLVNEIRIFGGNVPPALGFQCFMRKLREDKTAMMLLDNTVLVPDMIDGNLAGKYMSIALLNTHEERWITVHNVNVVDSNVKMRASVINDKPNRNSGVSFAPSQQRNIRILLKINSKVFSGMPIFFRLQFNASAKSEGRVEVEENFWTSAYRRQQNAWILFPTGRTPWGYDWHGPSMRNVHEAVETLANHIPGVPKHLNQSILPDPHKLFISGHSNGGQGGWFLLSHFPDSVIAGAPVAGYSKIQNYVPYYWNSDAHMDPILRGVLESAISEFNNDLYSSNLVGIPLLARTGGDDDNVPPTHSRMLVRLGKLNVQIDETSNGQKVWNIKTSNIRRFRFLLNHRMTAIREDAERVVIDEKHPLTYGPAHQILKSSQPLTIVIGTGHGSQNNGFKFLEIAQEIAHSWYLYGRGDSVIVHDVEIITEKDKIERGITGNLVLLGGPSVNYATQLLLKRKNSEVKFEKDGSFVLKHVKFSDPGIDQLTLIMAGTDPKGFDQVARLFPKRTGVPIPDWIITGPEVAWKGAGGLLGAG